MRVGADALAFARARRWAAASSAGLLLSVVLTATQGAVFGSLHDLAVAATPWIAVGSLAAGIAAAHSLGRCGPDPGELHDARADRR